MTYIADLSDSELRARLVNRGVPRDFAFELVSRRYRDDSARGEIQRRLAR